MREEGGPLPTPLARLGFSPLLHMASLPTAFLLSVLPTCPRPTTILVLPIPLSVCGAWAHSLPFSEVLGPRALSLC